jgi:hypothetical protein
MKSDFVPLFAMFQRIEMYNLRYHAVSCQPLLNPSGFDAHIKMFGNDTRWSSKICRL